MSPNSSKSEPSPLRLWPALVLLALLWSVKYLPSLFDEPPLSVFMIAFFGPAVCALLIVVWWVAGSRASWREKLPGVGGLVLIFLLTVLLLHPTMRGAPIKAIQELLGHQGMEKTLRYWHLRTIHGPGWDARST